MPSLLESFFFVFEGDTTKLKKSLDESDKLSDKLEQRLQGLDKTAGKVGEAFVDLTKKAGAAVASIVALGAIKKLVVDTADHTFALKQQAAALATSTENLSMWQNMARAMGGTADGATASLQAMHKELVEAARFPGAVTPFTLKLKNIGVTNDELRQGVTDPTAIYRRIAGAMQGRSAVQQQFIAGQFGISDQGLIAAMAQGRRALDEHIDRMKRLGVVTQQQAEAAAEFKYQTNELGIVFETVAREVTGVLLPPLTWLLRKVEDLVTFLRDHKNFTLAFFTGLGAVAADVLVPAFFSAAAAIWAFIAPVIAVPALIALVIAALALLYDDVQAFMNGQNSLIGEAAKKWPWFGDTVRAVVRLIGAELEWLNALIKDFFKYFLGLSQFIVDLFTKGPADALKRFSEKTKEIFDDLKSHFGKLWDRITGVAEAVTGNGPDQKAADGKTWGGSSAKLSGSEIDRGKYIADKLVKMGWTPEQAAGIAGSILQESRGDPNIVNPKSGARGIAQWLGSRVKDFEAYAGHSLSQSTLDEQIAFMNYELTQGKEQAAGRAIRATSTAQDAAIQHSLKYERAGRDEMNNARRVALGEAIAKGQAQLASASNNPMNATNSNVISNNVRGGNRTYQFTGDTTIHTQATDAKTLAQGYTEHLQGQLKNAQDQHDDGIAA